MCLTNKSFNSSSVKKKIYAVSLFPLLTIWKNILFSIFFLLNPLFQVEAGTDLNLLLAGE